ncbi:hypothetical protein J3F83DRAFT_207668 [Trichoderma novae-zelandiae]
MEPKLHEIDPNGDMLLIIRNANAPFAVPEPAPGPPQKRPKLESADGKPEVHMRLSSKHLALASASFKGLTANEWNETTADGYYSYIVNAEDWVEEAVLILMNIIHGRTAKVPRAMELELLAKIAVLVDYYRCHDAVQFFSETWLQSLAKVSSNRDMLFKVFISWVFQDADCFRDSTKALIWESKGPIDSLGLPIPQHVVAVLNEKREEHIAAILAGLNGLVKNVYSNKHVSCSFACSSMYLGALINGLIKIGLFQSCPPPPPPYAGHSWASLDDAIRNMEEPPWDRFCLKNRVTIKRSEICRLSTKPKGIVDDQLRQLKGLELKEFIQFSKVKII